MAQLICWLVAGLLPVYAVLAWRDPSMRWRFIEGIGLVMAMAFLPPLVGFALYFCLFHTARHMAHIWLEIKSSDAGSAGLLAGSYFYNVKLGSRLARVYVA